MNANKRYFVAEMPRGTLAIWVRRRIRRQPFRWCGALFQPMAYRLGRHELTCPENPEPSREPVTCLVCGRTLPRGAVLCWQHEGKCARFAELDALIAAEEEAAAKVKAA